MAIVIPICLVYPPQGRLTLTTSTPVMTATTSAQTTIYYTPYVGNIIPIYDGTYMIPTTFTELSNVTTASSSGSAGPAAVTTNSNYDLFVWSNSGTPTLTRGPLWTSDTARGTGSGTTELQRILGIYTNKIAITNGPGANLGTYVGTVRSNGTSTIDWNIGATAAGFTAAVLGVWNMYNRVNVFGNFGDSTSSWIYNTGTWRSADNSTAARVSYILGLAEEAVKVDYTCSISNDTGIAGGYVGIGYDSTSAASGMYSAGWTNGTQGGHSNASYSAVGLGFHYLQALERAIGSGNTSFFGSGSPWGPTQNGIIYQGRF